MNGKTKWQMQRSEKRVQGVHWILQTVQHDQDIDSPGNEEKPRHTGLCVVF